MYTSNLSCHRKTVWRWHTIWKSFYTQKATKSHHTSHIKLLPSVASTRTRLKSTESHTVITVSTRSSLGDSAFVVAAPQCCAQAPIGTLSHCIYRLLPETSKNVLICCCFLARFLLHCKVPLFAFACTWCTKLQQQRKHTRVKQSQWRWKWRQSVMGISDWSGAGSPGLTWR